MTVATVITHRRPDETGPALATLLAVARSVGATLRFDQRETLKHGLTPRPGIEVDAPSDACLDVSICFALGGDGTILSALRRFAATGVPVFAVNYGEVGFLATVDREQAESGFERAFAGEFERVRLPGLELRVVAGRQAQGERWIAFNDLSVQRRQGARVASLAYSIGDEEVGSVRCDGLVASTPVGSTGYNLANGGPVMAWGVEGYAVSFIAPHSLTARSVVVAPSDTLWVRNAAEDPVDVTADGRPVATLPPDATLEACFTRDQGTLAQMSGWTFYRRLRAKFGRLDSSA